MSTFCEEFKESDLSGKSIEELDLIKKNLNEKKVNFNSKRLKALNFIRSYDSNLREIDKKIKLITKELTFREQIEEAKSILNSEISAIENFKLLSETELSIITTKMDKTDYRKYGNYPRFNDFDRIKRYVFSKVNILSGY